MSERWFLDKFKDSNLSMLPIFWRMMPVNKFLDRFNPINPERLIISFGISHFNLLLKRSMTFNSPRVLLYSRYFSLRVTNKLSIYSKSIINEVLEGEKYGWSMLTCEICVLVITVMLLTHSGIVLVILLLEVKDLKRC